MATLPSASLTVQNNAGAQSSGADLICVMAPVATSADMVPRIVGNAAAILAQYGFSDGLEYAALHIDQTRKPVLFVGVPITTPGTVGRVNTSGNTGTSSPSVAVGGSGSLGEHQGIVQVLKGGIIGTDQILLNVSLDGGINFNPFRLGTATSYVTPLHGVTVSFAAGTLVTGDTAITWFGSAPLSNNSGWATAFANLAAQQKLFRSVLLVGDLTGVTDATNLLAQANSYQSSNARFIYARASAADRQPLALLSNISNQLTAYTSLTFTATTATRVSGSWFADGFAIGDTVTFAGTASNNVSAVITALSATVLTVAAGFAVETTAVATGIARPTLTFASGANTVTRNRGSWFADGFNIGDVPAFTGTASNNALAVAVTALTATVMTLASGVVSEAVNTNTASVKKGQTQTAWLASLDAAYSPVVGFRLDISAGRGRVLSPFSGHSQRRPAAWAASLREYQHDLMVATLRKSDGPTGFNLYDLNGNLVEYDDRLTLGAACAAQLTTFRTWGNGPNGAFVSLSITRDAPNSLLSLTHSVAVVNQACTTCQAATENALVGVSVVLNSDGTISTDAKSSIEKQVNDELERALLGNATGEGVRLSSAVWQMSATDILSVADATANGVLSLNLLGTILHVNTAAKIKTGG